MGFHIHNYATQFCYQFSDGLHWLDLESVSQQSLVYELHWDVNQGTMVKEKWYKNPPSIFNHLNHFGMFNDLGFFLANIAYNRGVHNVLVLCSGLIPRLIGEALTIWLVNILTHAINNYLLSDSCHEVRPKIQSGLCNSLPLSSSNL